ncbi:MAG: response regulator [Pseudomonadota bacterium]
MPFDPRMRVLVVDDYPVLRRAVANIVRRVGCENVEEVADGEIALARVREGNVGLVLAEWDMEPLSGFALLKEVRMHRHYIDVTKRPIGDTPFLLMAAQSDPGNQARAREAGVDGYLVKPFNADSLKQRLISIFGWF